MKEAYGTPERVLGCGCRSHIRFGNTRVTFAVVRYGAEFICPLGHVVGDVVDEDGQPVATAEVQA